MTVLSSYLFSVLFSIPPTRHIVLTSYFLNLSAIVLFFNVLFFNVVDLVLSQYLPDLPSSKFAQSPPRFPLLPYPNSFSCGVIPDIIRTCANGVAEGFALQVFAEMPTGQGRVGLFLLFSFNLEVLDNN